MVINSAVEIHRKSERIKMVLDAARGFLNAVDISGEDVTLREGFAQTGNCTANWVWVIEWTML